jgi:zinc transport system substrate-binding protein
MIHNMEVRTEEDIDNDEDYMSLMRYNLDTLVKVTE